MPSVASELQSQARALGDPTRHAIFRYLVDADRAVDVAELASHVDVNHNAVRQHLAKLVAADLIVETTAGPRGRGRPPLQYTVHPGAESRWGTTGPYERLALWLSEIIRTGESPFEVGRRIGRRQRLGGTVDEPVEALVDAMARHGFEPVARRSRSTSDVEIKLMACPFVSTVLADPDTVCKLHYGIANGVAEAVGGITVDELVPKDPRRANCRLRCHLDHDPA